MKYLNNKPMAFGINNVDIMEYFINNGLDIDMLDSNGRNMLSYCQNNIPMINMLIKYEASPRCKNSLASEYYETGSEERILLEKYEEIKMDTRRKINYLLENQKIKEEVKSIDLFNH